MRHVDIVCSLMWWCGTALLQQPCEKLYSYITTNAQPQSYHEKTKKILLPFQFLPYQLSWENIRQIKELNSTHRKVSTLVKDQERLRNCHRLEETTDNCTVEFWVGSWGSGGKNSKRTGEVWIRSIVYSTMTMLISWFYAVLCYN